MSNTVISLENLSKSYRLGQIGTGTLSNDLKRWWAKARGKPDPLAKIGHTDLANRDGEIIWALKDVSLDIEQGEVLGIIGRNGAGKSTLLKILSEVTAPTSGEVKIKGRIASLLEVGTGFHMDLTGRENTYLNGAILGMRKQEIRRKFDEIVEFAGVERFIDTPVKRYSSGMFVRLAFAVAAHLEPEILVVDEVLAVGDAEFQKKCLGKMGTVAKEGRTILFVSHNMTAIRQLCPQVIWLERGILKLEGNSDEVITKYLETNVQKDSLNELNKYLMSLQPDPAILFNKIDIRQDGISTNYVVTGKAIEIAIDYQVLSTTYGLHVSFILSDSDEQPIFRSIAHGELEELPLMQPGRYISRVELPADFLAPVTYRLEISASIYNLRHCHQEDIMIDLHVAEQGRIRYFNSFLKTPLKPKIAPLLIWNTEQQVEF